MASGVGSPACHFTSCGILDVILKPGEHDERISHGAEDTGMARDRMCKTHSRRRRLSLPALRPGRGSAPGGRRARVAEGRDRLPRPPPAMPTHAPSRFLRAHTLLAQSLLRTIGKVAHRISHVGTWAVS